ncbi:unnamed protein product, partial [Strongylus vulgaris]
TSSQDNCFPKPSGGCKCNVDLGHGEEVREFSEDADCKKSLEKQTAEHKKELNEEIKEKFGDFKENCFPKPSGGCKCNERDAEGNEPLREFWVMPAEFGCLCVIGKTAEGRDITERRMKDADCKCKDGERGPGCPAA